ncbi:MAG: hypothetical protein ACR2HG_14820 [Pyrinomonadaceae bacterium]
MFELKIFSMIEWRGLYVALAVALLVTGCRAQTKVVVPTKINTPTPNAVKADSKIKFTSVYTKLDSKTCKPIGKSSGEEEEVPYLCDGYGGYKVFVSTHGVATRIYIGREIPTDTRADSWDVSTLPSFIANGATAGQTIEWRLADGEPFACIVRAEYDKSIINPDEKGAANELVVQNLKGFAPISVTIDASQNKRANEDARCAADTGYGKP